MLSAFLFKQKINPLQSKIWAFTVFIFAIDIIMVYFHNSGIYRDYPHLIGISAIFPFMYGPLLFLYISIAGMKFKSIPAKNYLHFIPALLFLGWGIFAVYSQTAQFKINLVEGNISLPVLEFSTLVIPLHGFTYMFLSLIKMKQLKKRLKDNYSYIDKSTYYQIKHLVYGNFLIWTMVVVSFSLDAIFQIQFANFIIYIPLAFLIFNLGWKNLHSPELDFRTAISDSSQNEKSESYKKSGLTDKSAQEHLSTLTALMENEKPFLDNNLKLSDLAGKLNISAHNLSEILNNYKNQTFYDFVNFYRVTEVKNLILNDKEKKENLITLAFESGFSSKSSFNNTFKKYEGITPSEFRKKTLDIQN